MSKQKAINALRKRAFNARITMSALCARAGVSRSTMARWKRDPESCQPTTIARLERELTLIEQAAAAPAEARA